MTLDLLNLRPGLKEVSGNLERASLEENTAPLQAFSPALLKSIEEETLTLAHIDAFILQTPPVPSEMKQFLLGKKASLLLHQGQGQEALSCYDQALKINPLSPVTWALKGAALLGLGHIGEAFHAFQSSYSLRENFGSQKQGYLRDLFMGWSLGSVFLGMSGIAEEDTEVATKGVEEYLSVLEKAEAEQLPEAATVILKQADQAEPGLSEDIEEWDLIVRLLSIKDPFERARALAREVTEVWPEGVSAVDAIREQRDREWNQ